MYHPLQKIEEDLMFVQSGVNAAYLHCLPLKVIMGHYVHIHHLVIAIHQLFCS